MRTLRAWILADDSRTLSALVVGFFAVVALAIAIGAPLYLGATSAIARATYERPASVSERAEQIARSYASLLVDETEVRFDGESACPEEAIACVEEYDHRVIHINASLGSTAFDDPARFAATTIHEAAHVFGFKYDLDYSAFEPYSDTVAPVEVFADCASQAIVGLAGAYLDCPEEAQQIALDILGIKSAEMTRVGDRVDLTLQR